VKEKTRIERKGENRERKRPEEKKNGLGSVVLWELWNAGDGVATCQGGVRSPGGTEHFSGGMGSGQIGGGGGGNGGCSNSGSGSCCDMSVKCSCRWRLENQQYYKRLFSSGFVFFFGCFVLFGSIATLYGWVAFSPAVRTSLSGYGCRDDNEGSWSIGIFYGDSPFSLKPIEAVSFFSLCPHSFICMYVLVSPLKFFFF